MQKSFTSLIKLVRNQKFFVSIVNGTALANCFPAVALFLYTKAVDFCLLILYSETLGNSLMCFSPLLVNSLASLYTGLYGIMSFANRYILTVSFQICILLSSFSCLVLSKTSRTV